MVILVNPAESESMRNRRFLGGICLLVLVLGAVPLAASSEAGSRPVRPSAFIGMSPQTQLHRDDFRQMRRVGVGSLRFLIYWSQSEPEPGVFNWGPTDAFLASTARYGFDRLPVIWGSPSWVARSPRVGRCGFTADRCSALQLPVHGLAQRQVGGERDDLEPGQVVGRIAVRADEAESVSVEHHDHGVLGAEQCRGPGDDRLGHGVGGRLSSEQVK